VRPHVPIKRVDIGGFVLPSLIQGRLGRAAASLRASASVATLAPPLCGVDAASQIQVLVVDAAVSVSRQRGIWNCWFWLYSTVSNLFNVAGGELAVEVRYRIPRH